MLNSANSFPNVSLYAELTICQDRIRALQAEANRFREAWAHAQSQLDRITEAPDDCNCDPDCQGPASDQDALSAALDRAFNRALGYIDP